jgi:hypothetical protein
MLEEPFIFLLIFIISSLVSKFLFSEQAGMLRPIALRLGYIGVVFHELAHYLMSLVAGQKPKYIKVKWRDEKTGIRSPHGEVMPSKPETFLQAFISALAPLYISTWLIFYCWFIVPFLNIDIILKVIAGFLGFSLLITASPSSGDFRAISGAFRYDVRHSFYQVLLISLSVLILWLILMLTGVIFVLEVFYYLAIAALYHSLRFSFLGIKLGLVRLWSQNYLKPAKVRIKNTTRRRYKPKKPRTRW